MSSGVTQLGGLSSAGTQFRVTYDGGGQALTTGFKVWCSVQNPGTISSYVLLADQSGSIVITVKKALYADFPTFISTSVVNGGTPPTLSSAQKAQDSTLSGWTGKTLAAGDILEFEISSVSTITRAQLFINVAGV